MVAYFNGAEGQNRRPPLRKSSRLRRQACSVPGRPFAASMVVDALFVHRPLLKLGGSIRFCRKTD